MSSVLYGHSLAQLLVQFARPIVCRPARNTKSFERDHTHDSKAGLAQHFSQFFHTKDMYIYTHKHTNTQTRTHTHIHMHAASIAHPKPFLSFSRPQSAAAASTKDEIIIMAPPLPRSATFAPTTSAAAVPQLNHSSTIAVCGMRSRSLSLQL